MSMKWRADAAHATPDSAHTSGSTNRSSMKSGSSAKYGVSSLGALIEIGPTHGGFTPVP